MWWWFGSQGRKEHRKNGRIERENERIPIVVEVDDITDLGFCASVCCLLL